MAARGQFLPGLVLVFVSVAVRLDGQDLAISEFLAASGGGLEDEDRQTPDWIEVHNRGAVDVDLTGWRLTDDPFSLSRWVFPSRVLGAGEYVVVFASAKSRAPLDGELHTGFRLGADGEFLALVRPGGDIAHAYAPRFPPQRPGVSFGLALERPADSVYFPSPTPGAANGPGVVGFVAAVESSHGRGFLDGSLDVTVTTATPGAVIRYTLDGSWPTATTGTVYGGPITVDGTTMFRAAAFREDHHSGAVMTQTYISLDDVLGQDGAGFPPLWNRTPADYEMDPRIVDDPRYGATLRDDLKSIPTISIVMDEEDIFGRTGVYSNPERSGRQWERPCSVEYFEAGSGRQFQVNAGLRVHGGSSRRPDITPQHSLRLHFRGEYGAPKLEFPLFEDSEVTTFNTLVLSANSSDNWTSVNTATGEVAQFIRDQWTRDVYREMGNVASPAVFVHLYLNTLYWGLYQVVERVDDGFAAEHFGGDREDYDVIVDRFAFRGNLTAWNQVIAHTRANEFDRLIELLDIDNFCDYMIVEMFTGNWDWPDHNWHAVRRRAPGEKFRFVVWDAEVGLGLAANIPGPITPKVLNLDLTGRRPDVGFGDMLKGPGEIYTRLNQVFRDVEFRLRFADRLHRHLFNGGVLMPARARALYRARADEIEAALVAESARWGDVRRDPPDVPDGRWLEERNWILDVFLEKRPGIVLDQFRRQELYPDVDAPVFQPHGGPLPRGVPVLVQSAAGEVFYTIDGSDPRLCGGVVSPSAWAVVGTGAIDLELAVPTTIRARVRSGDQWSALNEATFHGDVSLRVTEIMYHPRDPAAGSPFTDDDFEFIELQNIGDESVDLSGLRLAGAIDFEFSGGTLRPGGVVVLIRSLPAFGERYPQPGVTIGGEYDGHLDNSGERVLLEGPSGEPILDFEYGDSWYPLTDGRGHSLVIRDPRADPKTWIDPGSWTASDEADGTPGVVAPGVPSVGQLPGDIDQNSVLDFRDAVTLLIHLFVRPQPLPCGDGTIACVGNRSLLDATGDGSVNLTDAIRLLAALFQGGPSHAQGTDCRQVDGCPDVCR